MPFDGAERFGGTTEIPSPSPLMAWLPAWLRGAVAPASFRPDRTETDEDVVDLLDQARNLIASPARWTQGRQEGSFDRRCAMGALYRAARIVATSPAVVQQAHRALLAIAHRRGFPSVEMMNDRSTHRAVLTAFDEAIATTRRRPAG
jgi:hypothetical protein